MAMVFSLLQSACELARDGAFLLLIVPAGFFFPLRAKCSWDEAEADIQHILLTGFPPADEMWLKVKTQLLDTIYGLSRFYQSHFVECFQLASSRWPLHYGSRDALFGLLSMGLVQPCDLRCLVSFWICNLLYTAEGSLDMCVYVYIVKAKMWLWSLNETFEIPTVKFWVYFFIWRKTGNCQMMAKTKPFFLSSGYLGAGSLTLPEWGNACWHLLS